MAHGHERAEKRHGGGEWLGPKLRHFLKSMGVTMAACAALFVGAGIPIVPLYLMGIGMAGGGLSMWGWSAAQAGDKKGGHGHH